MNTTSVTLPSFAKINWFLDVLGKRPDGYHEVVTVLQTISLHDELTFELREDGPLNLSCDDPTIPVDHTNLVMRAALYLQQSFQGSFGGEIHLRKRIPAQGGLGGGSSNAAIALVVLKKLWKGRDFGIE